MSRVPKWQLEKTKIKAVFRLQFQASHVPHPGWDKLFVSFLSIETGKLVGKTNKANVKNGNCKWADPVYETTRLLLDTRTKKYDEKIYKLVVSMGTSRSSLLGEVFINLADYADALKPSSVLLPLEGCASGTVLHVTIQLLTSKTGFRDFEKQQDVGEKAPIQSLRGSSMPADRVNARAKSKRDSAGLASLREPEESNEDYEDSIAGSYTSDSINTEKSDSTTTPETKGNRNDTYSGQDSQSGKEEQDDCYTMTKGDSTSSHNRSSDLREDNLAAACEDNDRLRGSLELAESSVSEFNMESCSSHIFANMSREETGHIAKDLASELAKKEVLAQEASVLKSECLKFEGDQQELKNCKSLMNFDEKTTRLFLLDKTLTNVDGSRCHQLESSGLEAVSSQMSPSLVTSKAHASFSNLLPNRTNVNNEDLLTNNSHIILTRGLSYMEEKIKEIQRKTHPQMVSPDFNILHSDLETIDSVMKNVKQAILPYVSSRPLDEVDKNSTQASGTQIEGSFEYENELEKRSSKLLKEKISQLETELERYKFEQDGLVKKMNQMEQYYEALIQELEDTHKDTINQLGILKSEHSTCFYTISALQGQLEKLNQDMNQQILRFAEDRRCLEIRNTELGKRAYTSESMLKKIRWNYSIAMDRLQKDLELLSHQVLSMFETNESFAKQAFVEASQLLLDDNPDENLDVGLMNLERHGLQDMYDKEILPSAAVTRVRKSSCKLDCAELTNNLKQNVTLTREKEAASDLGIISTEVIHTHYPQIHSTNKWKLNNDFSQAAGQDGFRGTMKPLNCDPINSDFSNPKQDIEAMLFDMFALNVNLDILMKVFQETLLEKLYEIRTIKMELTEKSLHLENTNNSNQAMAKRLQIALDDARLLKENEAKYRFEYDDLSLRNHILETKLQNISDENSLLSVRVAECQKLLRKFSDLELNYNSLALEKFDLEKSLEKEMSQKNHLAEELESTFEECKLLKAQSAERGAVIDGLQRNLSFVSERLDGLSSKLQIYGDKIVGHLAVDATLNQEVEEKIIYLEKLCEEAGSKIAQLTTENKEITEQSNTLRHTLNSKISSIQEITTKLDLSNTLVERLQLEVQDVYRKLEVSSEEAKIHTELCKGLSSKLQTTENKLHQAISENRDLIAKVIDLKSLNEELERDKSFFLSCKEEKDKLEASVQSKIDAAVLLENESCSLRNKLNLADSELKLERSIKGELENQIIQLTSQLSDRNEHIVVQEKEISNLRLLVSDLESQNSRLQNLVLQNEERQRKLDDDSSSMYVQVSKLECKLHNLKESLGSALIELSEKRELINSQENELLNLRQLLSDLDSQKSELQILVQQGKESRKLLDSEVLRLKENSSSLQLELTEKNGRLDSQKNEITNLHLQVSYLESQQSQQQILLLQHEEIRRNLDNEASSLDAQVSNYQTELHSLKEELRHAHVELESEAICRRNLECKISDLTLELNEKCQHLTCFEEQNTELQCVRQHILALESERSDLALRISASQERAKNLDGEVLLLGSLVTGLENELRKTQESLGCTSDELKAERFLKENLVTEISSLKAELLEKNEQVLAFMEHHNEYEKRRTIIINLEKQNAVLLNQLQHNEEAQQKLDDYISCLLTQLNSLLENLLAAEIKVVFISNQLAAKVERYADGTLWLDAQCEGINVNNVQLPTIEQNASLCNEIYPVEDKTSLDKIDVLANRVEGYNEKKFNYEARQLKQSCRCIKEDHDYDIHIRELKDMLQLAEEEMDNLRLSRDELNVSVCILMSKLNEQKEEVSMLGKSWTDLEELQQQNRDLSLKLSEQILKTEEFKILSIHLKELKDKSDAEYLHAHEKKDSEMPSSAVHESLRMAFVKEQCETKVQELKTQLHVSKRHGEELLLKLQNALDELEIRKKNEVSHLKRNEELSLKVLDLETELQKVTSDRRELAKTIDRMKAELECSSISLDCCKEEKQTLESSLRECNEERTKQKVELDLIKRRLDILASAVDSFTADDEQGILRTASFGQLLEEEKNIGLSVVLKQPLLTRNISFGKDTHFSAASNTMLQSNTSCMTDSQRETNELESETMKEDQDPGYGSRTSGSRCIGYEKDFKHEVCAEQIKERNDLQTSLHFLNSELERMKNDNWASIVMDKHEGDSELLDVQEELLQLTMANKQLGSLFPSLKEYPGTANPLKRVLALEIELAETLQARRKDDNTQSSYLKQQSNEETIIQTFRDMNELIKETLNLKARYSVVETELKEMHGRYSELSVQFAEVEGERQKLVMTLKNRTPKKH